MSFLSNPPCMWLIHTRLHALDVEHMVCYVTQSSILCVLDYFLNMKFGRCCFFACRFKRYTPCLIIFSLFGTLLPSLLFNVAIIALCQLMLVNSCQGNLKSFGRNANQFHHPFMTPMSGVKPMWHMMKPFVICA